MPTSRGEPDNFEKDAAAALHDVGDRVGSIRALETKSFPIDLDTEDVRLELIKQLDELSLSSSTALYAISLPEADPRNIHAALSGARAAKVDGRSYSRVLPLTDTPSHTIYVGSSRNLRARLLEHLGFGQKRTYSLHMLYWWVNDFRSLKIDIRTYDKSIDSEILGILEDYWASKLLPLFGRRGSV